MTPPQGLLQESEADSPSSQCQAASHSDSGCHRLSQESHWDTSNHKGRGRSWQNVSVNLLLTLSYFLDCFALALLAQVPHAPAPPDSPPSPPAPPPGESVPGGTATPAPGARCCATWTPALGLQLDCQEAANERRVKLKLSFPFPALILSHFTCSSLQVATSLLTIPPCHSMSLSRAWERGFLEMRGEEAKESQETNKCQSTRSVPLDIQDQEHFRHNAALINFIWT